VTTRILTKNELGRMGYRLRSFLSSEYVRSVFFELRRFYYMDVRKTFRTIDSKEAFDLTVPHNLKMVSKWLPRMELLIKPLSVIESVPKHSKVLVIGPRNEYDLLLLAANGFAFKHVRGVDLMSYSPKIDLGDMHAMAYPDNSWDVVLCGWTLSYSATPQKAAAEMVRVVRNGGVIGIGVEYSTLSDEDSIALDGYVIQDKKRLSERINTAEQCLQLFRPHVKDIFFCHDAPLKKSHTKSGYTAPSNVAIIFSIQK